MPLPLHSWLLAGFFGVLSFAIVADEPARQSFKPLSNNQAWHKLRPETPKLPTWARMLAESLPQTTGLMLELDCVHRLRNQLGSVLSSKVRWIVADANQCAYAKQMAQADLRRAGYAGDTARPSLPDMPESKIFAFARTMTRAAYSVTDDEVDDLIRELGPAQVVALVHAIAYANFQDRILLALGLVAESDEPLPPLEMKFSANDQIKAAPARLAWIESVKKDVRTEKFAPAWQERSLTDLRSTLDRQKSSPGRIALPDWERVNLPADVKQRSGKIAWSVVSLGYQPLLTKAWFDCMSTFQREAQFDRVFSNSFFWVITRTNDCFY